MRKRILRAWAVLAAATVLAAALAVSASAGNVTDSVIDRGRTCSVTLVKLRENSGRVIETDGKPSPAVSGEPMKGIRFSILKIADFAAVSGDEAVGIFFEGLDSGLSSLLTGRGAAPEKTMIGGNAYYTAEALEEAIRAAGRSPGDVPGEAAISSYVKTSGGAVRTAATDGDGRTRVEGLPTGLYLIAEEEESGSPTGSSSPEGAAEIIHVPSSPLLVCLPFTDRDTAESAGEWLYDVTVYPKNQTVQIPKFIVSEDDGDTLKQTEDIEIGESIREVIAADAPAPAGDGKVYESYEILDVMQQGLSFRSLDSVRLGRHVAELKKLSDLSGFETLRRGQDYEVLRGERGNTALTDGSSAGTKAFRVRFLEPGLAKLNALEYFGQVAVVFDAYASRDASDGEASANTNKPSLTAKNTGTGRYTVSGNEPGVFLYRIRIKKKGVNNPEKVSFEISRGGKKLGFVREKAGLYHLFDNDLDQAESVPVTERVSPDSGGTLRIRGLDADSYVFEEKTTEAGYELLGSKFTVTLTASSPADGSLSSAVLSIEGRTTNAEVAGGTASFSVENSRALTLRTGGSGNRRIYIACLIFAAAAGIIYILAARRRKNIR